MPPSALRLSALGLALAGCPAVPESGAGSAWQARIDRRVTIEEGAALTPDDAARPGEAAPAGLVAAHGKLYVLLQNLDRYAPVGPSFLAIFDPATLTLEKRVPLVLDGTSCRNANAMLVEDDRILVACSGRIALPPQQSDDGALFELAIDGTPRRRASAGRSPLGVARVGNDIWLGDGEGGGLSHLRADSMELLAGAGDRPMLQVCRHDQTRIGFVSDVATASGRLFATCFSDDTVVELDPATGAVLGTPLATGSGPLKMAPIGADLFALDNLGGTLTRVDLGPPLASDPALLRLGRGDEQGGNDPQGIAGAESMAGVTNSAYGTFVVVELQPVPHVVASVDLKATAEAPSNFPTAVAWDGTAFYVAVPGLEFSGRQVPSELVRVVVKPPGTTSD